MALKKIKIESVMGGHSATKNFSGSGQFISSIAVDPDMPIDDSEIRTSGLLRPTSMSKFSGAEITGVPLWMVSNPKDTNTYVYANDGKVHVVASSVAMGTALNSGNALSSSSGNGAAYYDNNLYFAKNTDIAQYGPLDGSPSLTQNFWTNSLGLTALNDTTYPSIRGIEIPNHPMHRHTDDKLYIGDVNSDNKGILSYIATTKTTNEGDTDNTSVYEKLDFDHGIYPTAIETFGNDLAVALIEGTDTTIKQKNAKISFWDTTSASFNKITDVEFPDPLITALKNVNGVLYVFSGNASGGVRVSRFIGGYTFEELAYFEEGVPPFQGAVDHILNRVIWGGYTTDPESSASVFSFKSKKATLPMGIHNILKSTSSGTNGIVTSIKYLEQANNSKVRPIIGWSDDSAKGLDKISTTYGVSVWRSKMFRIGEPFQLKRIRIPLSQAIAVNMTLTVKVYLDDSTSNATAITINNTNYPNSENFIDKFISNIRGSHNFFIELRWSGTALLTVGLPITIIVETTEQ